MIRPINIPVLDGFIEIPDVKYVPQAHQITHGLTAYNFVRGERVIFTAVDKSGVNVCAECPTFDDAKTVMRALQDGEYSDMVWYRENRFSIDQVKRLLGGLLPHAEGFDWKRATHFRLIDNVLHAHSEDTILPGPGLTVSFTIGRIIR